MHPKVNPINDLKELPDHMNTEILVATVKRCVERLDAIEEALKLTPFYSSRNKSEILINEVLANEKMWSFHSVHEEIQALHPELHDIALSTIQHALSRLARENKIEKITHGVYRKKRA